MRRVGFDDLVVWGALAWIASLCLVLRYLPMTDLPQHEAMVSIVAHRNHAGYGFAERFSVELFGPYMTVYVLGSWLAVLMPVHLAVGIVVALATVAPVAGAYALLRALGRSPLWALLVVPVAFGNTWHWGFVNFLLGIGLALSTLALVVNNARRPSLSGHVGVALMALITYFTHLHALAVLVVVAPVMTLPRWRPLLPLVPASVLAGVFTLTKLASGGSYATTRWLDPLQNITRFPDRLAAGAPSPWPLVVVGLLAVVYGLAWWTARAHSPELPRRALIVVGIQVALYFALPIDFSNNPYVSSRHALLIVVFSAFALPPPTRWSRWAACGVAAVGLAVATWSLYRFDREARAFDDIIREIPMNQRVASTVFEPGSEVLHSDVFPYLHFAAYVQADKGGDISFSFASLWNIPIHYHEGLPEHAGRLPKLVEWNPHLLGPREFAYFDYVVTRAGFVPRGGALEVVTTSRRWSLAKVRR